MSDLPPALSLSSNCHLQWRATRQEISLERGRATGTNCNHSPGNYGQNPKNWVVWKTRLQVQFRNLSRTISGTWGGVTLHIFSPCSLSLPFSNFLPLFPFSIIRARCMSYIRRTLKHGRGADAFWLAGHQLHSRAPLSVIGMEEEGRGEIESTPPELEPDRKNTNNNTRCNNEKEREASLSIWDRV